MFNYHANHRWMTVPVCACLIDTSHTSYHCSLWAGACSQWFILPASSMVLHVCCSTACPQVTLPCARVRVCASILERQKYDYNSNREKKRENSWKYTSVKTRKEPEWLTESYYRCVFIIAQAPSSLPFLNFALPVLVLELHGQHLSTPITYTSSARLTWVRERCCSVHPSAGSLCPLTQSSEHKCRPLPWQQWGW